VAAGGAAALFLQQQQLQLPPLGQLRRVHTGVRGRRLLASARVLLSSSSGSSSSGGHSCHCEHQSVVLDLSCVHMNAAVFNTHAAASSGMYLHPPPTCCHLLMCSLLQA
jgi:hypothetical protein